MLTIRLLRTGKKNQPSYKVVVTDKKNPPQGGRFVEEVGFYNPKTKEKNFAKDRITYWLSVGAQASDTVHNMLVNEKIIDQPKRQIIFTKKQEVEEPKAQTQAPAEEPKTEEPAPAEETKTEEPAPAEETKTEEPAPAEEPAA
ncbi:MAG: 30S ribosomal protein S16 [Candidatus Paceibacterota bacterium]